MTMRKTVGCIVFLCLKGVIFIAIYFSRCSNTMEVFGCFAHASYPAHFYLYGNPYEDKFYRRNNCIRLSSNHRCFVMLMTRSKLLKLFAKSNVRKNVKLLTGLRCAERARSPLPPLSPSLSSLRILIVVRSSRKKADCRSVTMSKIEAQNRPRQDGRKGSASGEY